MKEIDFVGHFNKVWECLFENLSQSPAVSGSELKIFFKVRTRTGAHTQLCGEAMVHIVGDERPLVAGGGGGFIRFAEG